MRYFSQAKPCLVYLCVLAALFAGLLFSSPKTFAATVPLRSVNWALVDTGGGNDQFNFSVFDPSRGLTIAGNSGSLDIQTYGNNNGVTYWTYYTLNSSGQTVRMAGFSVYDPKVGAWRNKTTVGIDSDVTSPVLTANGGVVVWRGNGDILRFAMYDMDLGNWVLGQAQLPLQGSWDVDSTGMVGWRTANGLGAAIYLPDTKQFSIGTTSSLALPVSYWFVAGTLNYTAGGVPGKLGLGRLGNNQPFWFNGNTATRAYFFRSRTSGLIPLPVIFWDMSMGANSWSWTFGEGGTSSDPSPFYTYNTAFAAPFNAVQTANGPGGSHQQGFPITPSTPHSISGTAANANGFKIAGASVSLSGTHSKTVTTDANGNYSFGNLTGNGNYTVTITKPRTTFTPPSRSYTNLTGAQTGNFTGKLSDKPADFDGDGKTDPSIFRPGTNEWWVLNSSTNSSAAVTFGLSTDKLVPRDYDGDGRTDFAVWRPSEGNWYILQSSTGTTTVKYFGTAGDIPVANDYDGDDKADIAVFRPSDANWYVTKSSNSVVFQLPFGAATDKVVPGDYDGDEKGDFAVFRPSEATWYVLRSSDFGVTIQPFGNTTDKPVQGDYDGDGKTDFATFTPLTAPASSLWNIKRSSDGVVPPAQPWGFGDDYLAPGDYDGDGKIDVGVFRPSDNTWYAIRSSDQVWFAPTFGAAGDYPVPNAYIPQ